MQQSTRRPAGRLALAVILAGLLVSVPGARAQDVSDQKVIAAAAAMQQIASLKEQYQSLLDEAALPDQDQIAEEAGEALTMAVKQQGLSFEEYGAIPEKAKSDPQLRGRIPPGCSRSSSAEPIG